MHISPRPALLFTALILLSPFVTLPTCLAQTSPSDVAGRWLGVFDTVRADGSIAPDTAFFTLQVEGTKVTGSAGNNAEKLSPIANGNLSADGRVEFDVPVNPSMTVHFHLRQEGDHLRGSATGLPLGPGEKIVIDTARWREGEAAPVVAHTQDGLFATIAALDKKLFDAYNHCDLATMDSLVSDNLEFYHDKTGLAVGRKPFIEAIRNNICGKVERTLVPGTLEVYPLAHYGAVEVGIHRFTHPGHPDEGVGEAKFVTIWQNSNGAWKITRAISYDHAAAKDSPHVGERPAQVR